ncbi:hypothetical protein C2G38_2101061 [Gigaspora rosea]|uniref:Uncharacterized protein n=1 Tax=Gigaspora rosea TaxID=44941 RepID=A0A397USU1_9GLOM|nr:hypothetical protein C2G38_2101061 [Gigaspora rosea]
MEVLNIGLILRLAQIQLLYKELLLFVKFFVNIFYVILLELIILILNMQIGLIYLSLMVLLLLYHQLNLL